MSHATVDSSRAGSPKGYRQGGYLSPEQAQQLVGRKWAASTGGAPAIHVRAADGGWWQVRHGGREQLMQPMCSGDWDAWLQHFLG